MIRGVHVDNKKMQKAVDNLLARQMRRAISVAEDVMKDLSKSSIKQWYGGVNASHIYTSIPHSVKIDNLGIEQNKKRAWCDIRMYIDNDTYLARTMDEEYHIYDWAYRHKKSDTWASNFVLNLQWNKNIVGLPSPYAHLKFDENIAMGNYVAAYVKQQWAKTVNRRL